MSQTIQEENKALVLDAFDTLFNKRDYAAAEKDPDLVVTEVQRLKDWIGTLRDRTIEQPVQSTERNSTMKVALDKGQFGPWALVTGASSGIGKEFARQIAASGINVVLVARRDALLAELGRAISQEFDVQYRALAMDLSQEGFIAGLADAKHDLDIGLVVSNAGTPNPGEFLKLDRQLLQATLRLNTMAHLDITHHFGAKLAERRRGGLILVGAMGAENGIPCMANDGAAKAYVHSLGEALHYEFKPLGVYVTVLAAGFTNTAVLDKFGLDPKTMPMKPMSVEQCVSEALSSLRRNRSKVIPGRLNRILNALVPASLARKIEAALIDKGLAIKSASALTRGLAT